MEYKDLIPLSDYHYNLAKELKDSAIDYMGYCKRSLERTVFGRQAIKLSMFIPCDENEKPLEPVIQMDYIPQVEGYKTKHPQECYESDLEQYQKALDKVIFEGFSFEKGISDKVISIFLNGNFKVSYTFKNGFIWGYETIEDLTRLGLKAKY